ncbi:MAG: DUF433 domain-containing protein, partial [Synechocystis sp.]
TIAGTRITLYDIMDYLQAQYPPKFIQEIFELTEAQLSVALAYIETNKESINLEYQEILKSAAETRHYWEQKNRERLEQIASAPAHPGYEAVRAKLQQRRTQREALKQ